MQCLWCICSCPYCILQYPLKLVTYSVSLEYFHKTRRIFRDYGIIVKYFWIEFHNLLRNAFWKVEEIFHVPWYSKCWIMVIWTTLFYPPCNFCDKIIAIVTHWHIPVLYQSTTDRGCQTNFSLAKAVHFQSLYDKIQKLNKIV